MAKTKGKKPAPKKAPAAKAKKAAPSKASKTKAPTKKAPPAPKSAARGKAPPVDPGWMDAGKGHALAIRANDDGDLKLVAKKDGKELGSVPKPLKESPIGEKLGAALDFLEEHARTCLHTVETWMLRSLPVPRGVLESVLPDENWSRVLRDAWVVGVDKDGKVDREAGGFFRGVDKQKGIGVVDRDGETTWLDTETVVIPHPVVLDEVDDLRELAVQVGVKQGLSQLFRETFVPPKTPPEDPHSLGTYAGGEFAMLSQAIGLARRCRTTARRAGSRCSHRAPSRSSARTRSGCRRRSRCNPRGREATRDRPRSRRSARRRSSTSTRAGSGRRDTRSSR